MDVSRASYAAIIKMLRSESTQGNSPQSIKKGPPIWGTLEKTGVIAKKNGADFQTRTGDPILTMDVLYLLS